MEPFEFPPEIFGQVPLFAEIAKAMSWSGGPVNWDIAKQIATAIARSDQTAPVISEDIAELTEATRLAQAWVASATGLGEPSSPPRLVPMTATELAEHALSLYPEVIDPLAAKLNRATMPSGDEPGAEIANVLGNLVPLFLGIQAGSVIGGLSRSALSGYDAVLPLEDDATISIVTSHVDRFARDTGLDRREVRYWVVARATAVASLFESLPWTRAHFFSLYHRYLAGIEMDIGDALGRLQQLDLSDPRALEEALGGGLFGLGDSPSAGPALAGLQRYLALIEATVGRATAAATHQRLASNRQIAQAIAERATEGTPTLEGFLGVEVPDDVAHAAEMFVDRLLAERGWPLVVSMWSEPDRLPEQADLDDPARWIERSS